MLQVRLLGGFAVFWHEAPVSQLSAPRQQSLLAYLLLHADTSLSRAHAAFVLWPDLTETAARNNLRQTLHQLRQALPQLENFLRADTEALHWSSADGCQVDVQKFEAALDAAKQLRATNGAWIESLEAGVRCYAGDLLPGCYDDWIVEPRAALRAGYTYALEQLVQVYTARRELTTALGYAETWAALDRLRDEPTIALMGLYAENGDQAAALSVYERYAAAVRQELDVAPAPEAAQLAERLRSRHSPSLIRLTADVAPTRLIGRRSEWQVLAREWNRAAAGEARMVVIEGEAGIGKSRLADELTLWVTRQGYAAAQATCYAAEGQLSLAPVAAWLRSDVLRTVLASLPNLWVSEAARLMPELLLEHPALPRPAPISEYGGRLRFFEALARIVVATARPLLLFIDDIQWCDQETLDWLHVLMRFARQSQLLVVAAVRDEELSPAHPMQTLRIHLQHEGRLTELPLLPLDAAESAQLAALIAGKQLDDRSALRLFQHTEGNPLFIVETIRAGEVLTGANVASDEADAPLLLPPRVQAVIAGRLAQLSPAGRTLAELAAAIGRPFDLDLLLHANDGGETETMAALDELWQRRILREQPTAAASFERYDFTHEKLREVVYGAISAPRRRLLHHRIAEALAVSHAGSLDQIGAELAAHYDAAGQVERAIHFYAQACEVAESLYALDDALRWTQRALILLEQQPVGELRDRTELRFLLALARIYRITRGWADHELEAVLERAQSLCVAVGDSVQRSQVLYGLQSVYVVQARHDDVLKLTEQSAQLAHKPSAIEPPSLALVHPSISQLHVGAFRTALERFDRIAQVDDRAEIELFQQVQGVNYLILADCNRAEALWCLGLPDAAVQCCTAGWEQARMLDQPFSQALAATYMAMVHELRGDSSFLPAASTALALATEFKAIYYQLWARILVAYGKAIDDPSVPMAIQLREAIDAFRSSGAGLRLPYYLSLLARVWQAAGHVDDAAATLDEALATAAQNNEHWWDAELHRLRGNLLAQEAMGCGECGQLTAENHYLLAMQLAGQQQALSLQLRAALGLAVLWLHSGQAGKVPSLLQPIYEQFVEGHATADMIHAQQLLAQVAALHA